MATPAQPAPGNTTDKVPLTREILQRLYESMLKCRMVEGRAAYLARQGKVPKFRAHVGREAMEVGATFDLQPDDVIAPSPRAFVSQVVRGTALPEVFAGVAHSAALPIAVQIQLATGIAVALKAKASAVVLALSTGGPAAAREWLPIAEYAAAQKLPVVYFFEGEPPRASKASLRAKYAIPEILVDGGDVIAVFRVAREAINHARLGRGPSKVYCVPFVARGARRPQDPLEHIEAYLQKHGLWTVEWKRQLVEHNEREIAGAIRGLKKLKK